MNSRALAIGVLTLLFVMGMPISALQATQYDISVSPGTEIQSQTVDLKGSTYEVSSIGNVAAGSEFTVTATAPADETYDVYLYNSDEQIVDTASSLQGSDSATFETDRLEPGTYVAALRSENGTFQAIEPVVVDGFDINLDYPQQVTQNEEFTLTATVDATAASQSDIERVEVVVESDEKSQRYELSAVGGETYERTLSLDRETEYDVYLVVRGSDMVDGEREVIGLSTRMGVTVQAEDTATATATATPTESAGGGGSSTETATSTSTPESSDTGTATETATPATSDSTAATTPTATATPSSSGSTTAGTPTTDSVITPGTTSEPQGSDSATTETTGPLPAWIALLSILSATLLLSRRR